MKKYLLNGLLLLALSLIALSSLAAPLQVQLSGSYIYSDVNGFIQIPIGGRPGTTTLYKPNLSDIGINHDDLWNTQLDLMKNAWGAFLNYQNQEQTGHAVLSQTLLTHGVDFPVGTSVSSKIKFNLLTAGAYYNFTHQQLTVRPILAVTDLNFYYSLASQTKFAKRHFTHVTPRIGLGFIYQINPKFNVSLTGLSSIPDLVHTAVYSIEAKGDYTFYQTSHYSVNGFVGLAYQQIKFKDQQTVPNNIQLTNWPMVFIGLSIKI